MSVTELERDPFDISEGDVRVGPVSGFYPVPSIEIPGQTQYWITKTVQDYDSMCLAEIIRQGMPVLPDLIVPFSRGALGIGRDVAYYNDISIVPGLQTEGYPGNTSEGRHKLPTVVSQMDADQLKRLLDARGISEPTAVLVDDLSESLLSMELGKQILVNQVGLKSENIKTALLYDKQVPRTRDHGCHLIPIDFFVRGAPGEWLDHASQATRERLVIRQEHLAPYMGEMARAAAFFTNQIIPDAALMRRIIAQSAVA